MDTITEAILKSFRQEIDEANAEADRMTRVVLMLAAHLGYVSREELSRVIRNPQPVHAHVLMVEEKDEEDGDVRMGIQFEITQQAEDDEAQMRAKTLPRFKLERAYLAERERADLAEAELIKARTNEPDKTKVGRPEAPTLEGRER